MKLVSRRVLVVTAVLAAGVATAGACSFPDPTFTDDSSDAAPDHATSGGDSALDGNVEAAQDGAILLDGSDPDALVNHDAGMKVDGSACGPTDCDCDGDGYKVTSKDGCEGGLNDCDDLDMRANPNQGFLYDQATAPMFGDWNCDTKIEKLYPEGFDCTKQAVADCPNAAGFADPVDCGGLGTLQRCKVVSLTPLLQGCQAGTTVANTQQACK